jgi:uncharacterized DUF497 family protein
VDSVAFDGFEWDIGKSDLTYDKHGIDFEAAIRVFDDVYVQRENKIDHGEPRYLAIGMIDEICVAVVWTPRARNRRIITARRARDSERILYDELREKVDEETSNRETTEEPRTD